jgi:nitroreductase
MGVMDTIRARRTIRFYEQRPIPVSDLRELVEAARLAPSGGNLQPLEYVLLHDQEVVSQIFPTLAWAGGVTPRRSPPEGKRPVAYVVFLINREVRSSGGEHDAAAAIENLLLAAWEKGIGGCWIGSVNRDEVRRILGIPDHLHIDSVVSLGYPAEQPVAEDTSGSVEYYLDDADTLHIPKRRLADILHENRYGTAARDG